MNSSVILRKPQLMVFIRRCYSQIDIEKLLSEESREKTIEKFKKYTKLRIGDVNPDKHAAILIPLCISNNQISLLYTIRSSKLRYLCFSSAILIIILNFIHPIL